MTVASELDCLSVLLVDRDPSFLSALHRGLAQVQPAWRFYSASALSPAATLHGRDAHGALVVDVSLLQLEQAAWLCREVKQASPDCVLVVISQQDSLELRAAIIGAGASEFVSKNWWHPVDLATRIKARVLLRWQANAKKGGLRRRVSVGALEIDTASEVVFVNGVPTPLTLQQRRMMMRLAQTPGEIVSYTELCRRAGIQEHESNVNLHNQVSRLRKRLGPAASVLRAAPGQGLCLGERRAS